MPEKRFLYDGWNLVAELNASGVVTRRFVWGLDVSGSTQGAGGVGGLLAIVDGANTYRPIYDASHNVIGLYDQGGNTAAAYEYDPFGNVTKTGGPYAAANPFRFSTKYTDTETGLIYYGHRYYDPQAGRFINRDPIEESGGLNLYGFCGNDGVNRWDYLGLHPVLFERTFPIYEKVGDHLYRDTGQVYRTYEYIDIPDDGSAEYFSSQFHFANGQSTVASDSGQVADSTAMRSAVEGTTTAASAARPALTPEREAELRANPAYARYIEFVKNWPNSSITFDTPDEAHIAGALLAAVRGGTYYEPRTLRNKGAADTYGKHEYIWGIVKTADGNYVPTAAITNKHNDQVNAAHNPEIEKARADGTLVGVGHNHPWGGRNPMELSGYGHGGLTDHNVGDKRVAQRYGRIYLTNPVGNHRVGNRSTDSWVLQDPKGADFEDLSIIMRREMRK